MPNCLGMSSARAAPPTFKSAPIRFDVDDLPNGNRMFTFLGEASLEREPTLYSMPKAEVGVLLQICLSNFISMNT